MTIFIAPAVISTYISLSNISFLLPSLSSSRLSFLALFIFPILPQSLTKIYRNYFVLFALCPYLHPSHRFCPFVSLLVPKIIYLFHFHSIKISSFHLIYVQSSFFIFIICRSEFISLVSISSFFLFTQHNL